jgi:hypothetical protein
MAIEAIKLTEEEMNRINSLRASVSYNIESIGRICLRTKQLERELAGMNEEMNKALADNIALGQEEDSIIASISEKYGDGQINLETGEYFPASSSEETSEEVGE